MRGAADQQQQLLLVVHADSRSPLLISRGGGHVQLPELEWEEVVKLHGLLRQRVLRMRFLSRLVSLACRGDRFCQ